MRMRAIGLVLAAGLLDPVAPRLHGADRSVAVTCDDLPAPSASLVSSDVAALRENTEKLLASFRKEGVPVVGFVNEGEAVRER